jgi:chromosome partitioning protein
MDVQALPPFVIAVFHQKGGVAKTTTVLNLGACLAKDGHTTLVIDLDPTGSLTSGLGYQPADVPQSIVDVLLGNETILSIIQETVVSDLSLIPAHPDLGTAAKYLSTRKQPATILRTALSGEQACAFERILLDCPPSGGLLTVAALTAAHLLIVPVLCDFYAIQSLESVFHLIKNIRRRANRTLRYRLLVTLYNSQLSTQRLSLDRLRQTYGFLLFENIIEIDDRVQYGQAAGLPLILCAPQSQAAAQYQNLAKEVNAYVQNTRTTKNV